MKRHENDSLAHSLFQFLRIYWRMDATTEGFDSMILSDEDKVGAVAVFSN